MNARAADSFRFESLVRTISPGMPGFTNAALKYSVPRSMPRTEMADVGVMRRKRKASKRIGDRASFRRRPGGAIVWRRVPRGSVLRGGRCEIFEGGLWCLKGN